MTSNTTAWLTGKGVPLSIEPSPRLEPKPNEILIKSRAVAINPVDWAMQLFGSEFFSFLKFPCPLGYDVAGEIVAVGSDVTRAKIGDRVLGMPNGSGQQGKQAAFQEYTIIADNLFSLIPDTMTFEDASVIPVCLATAACGMFEKDNLALPYPSLDPKPLGKTLVVWAGSSSVGCNAIQLGVAAGCDVITTCSPNNFELVKKLGASHAFDYNSETVVSDMLAYLEDKILAGAIGIGSAHALIAGADKGHDSATTVLEVVSKANGNKFVAMASQYAGPVPDGVTSRFFYGNTLANNELGAAIFEDYLPKALAAGKFAAAPEPLVVGNGLESIQHALEVQKKGVSGKKVVVSL